MGFGGFVIFALKCFDVLAWPLFALGYPLCASIQAIETDSNWHTKKLVTYWVLFSLISLFEHAFVKLLEWVPFWSYTKLMIICWLVIPHFDGALYIYKHLVRPCLSMDLQILINWFDKWKGFVLKRDDILAEAERHVKENGPEALEKLIASKSMSQKPYLVAEESRSAAEERAECQEPSVLLKDIKPVEVADKKEVTAAKEVNQLEPNLAHIKNRTFAPVEINGTTTAVESGWDIPAFKEVQNEWTCAPCQVTTTSKTTLNSHLRGRRHQAACEELKAKNQASKSKVGREYPKIPAVKEVQNEWTCAICQVTTTSKADLDSHFRGSRHQAAREELKANNQASKSKVSGEHPKIPAVKEVQNKWTCAICQVTTTSKTELNSHLRGSRHQAAREELKAKKQASKSKVSGEHPKIPAFKEVQNAWSCAICQVTTASKTDLNSHLRGRRHQAACEELKAKNQVSKVKFTCFEVKEV